MFTSFLALFQNKDNESIQRPNENIFREFLSPEITIQIAMFLQICDLNNLARCNQEFLLLFFNLSIEKVNALSQRKQELRKLDIESRIVSVKDKYQEDENQTIQQVIWKPLVLYYFPNYSKSLNVKNWMHVLRRRVIHLQNKHPNELPFSKINKGVSTYKGGLYRDNKDRQTFVENCEWEYECPLKTIQLEHVLDGVKFCNVCKENVYEVTSETEFESRVRAGHCIAFYDYIKKDHPLAKGKVAFHRAFQ